MTHVARGFLLLSVLAGGAFAADAGEGIRWRSDLTEAAALARRTDRPLLVTFSATWCGPCRRMHREAFADREVVEEVNAHFVPVLLDADEHADLVERLGVEALPGSVLIAPDGGRRRRVLGYRDAGKLMEEVRGFRATAVAGRARVRS